MEENLEIRPWLLRKTVLPQNTDHAGVMWHGSYLSWLEEARILALYKVGLEYSEISNEGYELPVVNLQMKYMKPLLHGENILLETRFLSGKGAKFRCDTHFFKDSRELAALAKVDLVLIKRENLINKLIRKGPVKISDALYKLEKGPSS